MDILNNIWTAISTPNASLSNALNFPLALFCEQPLSLLLFTSVLGIKPTKKQSIIYIVLTSFIVLLTSNFIPGPINFIINYILFFLTIYFVFKLNIFKTIIAMLLPAISFSLVGSLVLNPYLNCVV